VKVFREKDWKRLEELRDFFLSETANAQPYWDEELLALYEQTFAERIGWKWDAVLRQLEEIGWVHRANVALDWGCGTGVATRKIATSSLKCETYYLADHSTIAQRYAWEQLGAVGRDVRMGMPKEDGYLLLLSHILGEMTEESSRILTEVISKASAVIWVEPGNYPISRRLGEWRNRLELSVVAPCTHQGACEMLLEKNRQHWCHFFAEPPPEVFMSSEWAMFANRLEIDLRSLPYSYLVLDRRLNQSASGTVVIGRSRVYKATAKIQVCDEKGVRDFEVTKRHSPVTWKRLKKGDDPTRIWLDQVLP
jgi:hypothetical protein